MLKKLRIRLICIIMLIVVLTFTASFAAIGLTTQRNLNQEAESMMRSVASQPLQGFGFGRDRDRDRISLPYFLLEVNAAGILTVSSGSFDLSDEEELDALLDAVEASGSESGYLKDYGLRYLKQDTPFGYKVVFADTSSQQAAMQNLVRTMLLIGALVFAAFLLIAIFFARWAVKPVEEAWQQQKQFISDASHELKTPLTVITTNAELLSAGCSEEEQARYAGNISAVSHQMRSLVEDLLNLARLDNGTEKASYTDVDLSSVIADELLPFEPIFFEKGLELSEEIEPGLTVHGSESRIKQLLDILLDNAQKYSDPGKVSVSLKKSQKSAILTVSNPGRALTPAQREDIFKRFYRADEARSEKGSYGLGLPIARSIAEAHGGKLVCESEDGQNRFIATLPLG